MGLWDIAASGIIQAGANAAYSQFTAQQQFDRQKQLMGIQYENQRALNQMGRDIQMDIWNKTNYEAQLKHLKAAGLNPSLMYSKGGQGGVTGGQSGGSASGGNAAMAPMIDLAALNFARTQAEIKLMESQALKNEVDAGYTAGIKTDETRTNIQLLLATVTNTNAKTALTQAEEIGKTLQNKLDAATLDTRTKTAEEQLKLYKEQVQNAVTQNGILQSQANDLVAEQRNKVALQVLQMDLLEAQKGLTDAQKANYEQSTKKLIEDIRLGWAKIANEKRALDQKDKELYQTDQRIAQEGQRIEIDRENKMYQNMKLEADKLLAMWQSQHPTVMQSAGGMMESAKNSLYRLLGLQP